MHGHADGWLKPGAALDFFDVKGVVEELVRALGHEAALRAGARTPGLHPNIAAHVYVDATKVGVVGELHPDAARALGVEGRPLVFELDLQALRRDAAGRRRGAAALPVGDARHLVSSSTSGVTAARDPA